MTLLRIYPSFLLYPFSSFFPIKERGFGHLHFPIVSLLYPFLTTVFTSPVSDILPPQHLDYFSLSFSYSLCQLKILEFLYFSLTVPVSCCLLLHVWLMITVQILLLFKSRNSQAGDFGMGISHPSTQKLSWFHPRWSSEGILQSQHHWYVCYITKIS